MAKALRVLLIEDSENDAVLLLRELKRSGYDPVSERVCTASDLNTAIETQSWDIIISDFVMPQFSGPEALKIIREKSPVVPVIIMSGKISDETAVTAMKAGASDYIMKDNLVRLGPAIERELYETAMRIESEKASAALREREDELRALKKLNQLKDEFVGLVSHELRTPLTVILGALSTIMTEGDKISRREIKQLIGDAYFEAENLSDILANLLELARAQANRLQITMEQVDICEVINSAVSKMTEQSKTHSFLVGCKAPVIVTADRVRIQRILHNLLENAAKYSDPGTKIEIFARLDNGEVLIGVKDMGIGIPADLQGKLFEPFQRLEQPNIKATGTGLGLIVCRRLVEAHGGRMWLESEPGEGSTFQFTLPLTGPGNNQVK